MAYKHFDGNRRQVILFKTSLKPILFRISVLEERLSTVETSILYVENNQLT